MGHWVDVFMANATPQPPPPAPAKVETPALASTSATMPAEPPKQQDWARVTDWFNFKTNIPI